MHRKILHGEISINRFLTMVDSHVEPAVLLGMTVLYNNRHREDLHSCCVIMPKAVYAGLWRSTFVEKSLPIPNNKQQQIKTMGEQTARLFNDLKDFNEDSRHVVRAGYRDFTIPIAPASRAPRRGFRPRGAAYCR